MQSNIQEEMQYYSSALFLQVYLILYSARKVQFYGCVEKSLKCLRVDV